MKLIEAKVNWVEYYSNLPHLEIVVDEIPYSELLYKFKPPSYYYAEAEGYVNFFSYYRKGQGFGGRCFTLKMENGTETKLFGPYSSRSAAMNFIGFEHCIDVSIINKKEGYNSCFSGSITIEFLKQYSHLIEIGTEYNKRNFKKEILETVKFPEGSKFDLLKYESGIDITYIPVVRFPDGNVWIKGVPNTDTLSSDLAGEQIF